MNNITTDIQEAIKMIEYNRDDILQCEGVLPNHLDLILAVFREYLAEISAGTLPPIGTRERKVSHIIVDSWPHSLILGQKILAIEDKVLRQPK